MIKKLKEIGQSMHALDVWEKVRPYNWGIKPMGTAIPYFCTCWTCDDHPVHVRFLLLEGWQTLHDFVRTRIDRTFGFYSTPMEMPHFEMVVFSNGEISFFRHDPGYVPRALTANEETFVARMLWEAYGVMMRLETEDHLALSYSQEKAMFARVETSPGVWEDAPLQIPDARPYVEEISFAKKDIAAAKDLPLDAKACVEADFRLVSNLMTRDERPRLAYVLMLVDSVTGEKIVERRFSVLPDHGLKELWENVPPEILKLILAYKRLPGEIKVVSGRLFRMMRPLTKELPFKLSLHDHLPHLEEAYKM